MVFVNIKAPTDSYDINVTPDKRTVLFSDEACEEQIFPESARDTGHTGCCGTGCIDGIATGSCCCERFSRAARPCKGGECFVAVDFVSRGSCT